MSYLNDPRVLFATERTLLAWNRTAIGLMGFGFLVERFGLFLRAVVGHAQGPLHQQASLIIGVAFILLGVALLELDRWLDPRHRYFKVRGDDGDVYLLRHDVPEDVWELTLFSAGGGRGPQLSST